METHDRHRIERHARRVEELRLWRNAREHRIEEWSFVAGDGKPRKIKLGDFWPEIETPVFLSTEVEIPKGWDDATVELELWLGGEGFVRLSNGVTGGLNPFHRAFPVADQARAGERISVEAEVVSKGLWGSHVTEPRIERAALVIPEAGVRGLLRDLAGISAACAELDDHDAVPHLLDAVDEALAMLAADWPTHSGAIVARYLRGYEYPAGDGLSSLPSEISSQVAGGTGGMRAMWNIPESRRPLEPLPEAARRAVAEAREVVAARLDEIKKEYPPVGQLALTGHAHIDLAWLWPLAETRRKARRTFSSVLGLMDRYEDFTFNQSSAQLYAWTEEDDPELFERIKQRVAEGRWEPVGGMWCELDCQIPSGESFVRQLLHGQRYFQQKFGRRSTVAWLPDAFGFSPGIPQLLRGAGITGFYTAKLKWNESNHFPLDLFHWEGIDGSRVTAHFTWNPGMDYNGDVAPFDLLGVWRNFGGKRRNPESLFPFGWGDGGGGPSEEMLENYARLSDFPALPRLRTSRVDEFFESLPQAGLPRWVGELYLELHRGTLTTQALVKKLNREAEHRLLEAEAFAVMADPGGTEYPAEDLDRLWKMLLLNQFHDILPGSSISEVYTEAHEQLRAVVGGAEKLRAGALNGLMDGTGSGDGLLVANAGLAPRPLSALLPEGISGVSDDDGRALPVQQTEDGLLVYAPDVKVPGLGWRGLRAIESGEAEEIPHPVGIESLDDGWILENELLRVEIGADGTLLRVYDRVLDREVLDGRGNQLWAYMDKPANWDAWDVDEGYEGEGEEISPVEKVEVVERGPLRAVVRIERRWRSSRIVQTYGLLAASRRLDIVTEIDWREREVLLRAFFPVNVRSGTATFETMYGAQERPTHRNTSWDAARFEVSAHRFADLSEPGYGVALLNDGKYGHSVRDNVFGLSLLRSPLYPDPLADEGEHRFTCSLFPHPGGWTESGVVDEAFALNSPLIMVAGSALPAESGSFVRVDGLKLALGSLKRSEDGKGAILRLYEPHGARGTSVLRFGRGVSGVERVNLLEEATGDPTSLKNGTVQLDVRPFEVVSLRVK